MAMSCRYCKHLSQPYFIYQLTRKYSHTEKLITQPMRHQVGKKLCMRAQLHAREEQEGTRVNDCSTSAKRQKQLVKVRLHS